MKKTFNILLPLLLLVLGYLVYLQWFSSSKPLLYRMTLKTTIPSELAMLPIKEAGGAESAVPLKNHGYTLFLTDVVHKGQPLVFPSLQRYHELLTKQGYRIVYLWGATSDELSKLSEIVQNDRFATHALIEPKLPKYQKLGLQFSSFPNAFVYGPDGKLIYQKQALLPADKLVHDLLSLAGKEANRK